MVKNINFLRKILPFMAVAFSIFSTSSAVAQDVVVLWLQSLDSAAADLRTLAESGGASVNPESFLGLGFGNIGIKDISFIDRALPLVAALPFEGMMMPQSGLVFALPAKDVNDALESVKSSYASWQLQGELHTFNDENGPALYGRISGNYLIFGAAEPFVKQFDFDSALKRNFSPSGNILLDVFIEPMTPLINMGLMAAEQKIKAQTETLKQQAGNQPGHDSIDTQSLQAIAESYLSAAKYIVSDVSRVQAAIEVVDDNGIIHFRFEGKTGGVLSELAVAQKGGLPNISGIIDEGSAAIFAGNASLTVNAQTLLTDFLTKYMASMKNIINQTRLNQSSDPEAVAMAKYWDWYMGEQGSIMSRSLDCMRGDIAGSVDFDAEDGISFIEVIGQNDKETCRSLMDDNMKKFKEHLAQNKDLAKIFRYETGPKAGDFSTYSLWLDAKAFGGAASVNNPEAVEAMNKVWGKEGLKVQIATGQDIILAAGGKNSEMRLKETMAVAKNKSSKKLPASTFHPLKTGPGYFFKLDLARLMDKLQPLLETGKEGEKAFPTLKDVPANILMSFLFDHSGVTYSIATPLKGVRVISSEISKGNDPGKIESKPAPDSENK